ncbi:hypothetical protein TEA_010211 [Camellia sinensis var. sinensis]|uniref:Uncharacterized protein n=1 Tax=Camellia sinensis var. sinensis TaxID=542762 RepID=A0A4S4DRS1_CAMSN|nr:hypothetical protein TEA_010211 [Camellia sinensis var. sinensis]
MEAFAVCFHLFRSCVGLQASCCLFTDASKTLEDTEKAMLELYCERARIKDGHYVLDVGYEWGSLSLYIAQKYSNCKLKMLLANAFPDITMHASFHRDLQLQNLEVIVADIDTFDMDASYDRIFSIEMFEACYHMKNYKDLLRKISKWMKPDSLVFVHHFCHKAFAYHFEAKLNLERRKPWMEGDAMNACNLQCNIYKYAMEWIFTKCMTMQCNATYWGNAMDADYNGDA